MCIGRLQSNSDRKVPPSVVSCRAPPRWQKTLVQQYSSTRATRSQPMAKSRELTSP